MEGNSEISGSVVTINSKQNVLETDTLEIQYALIPVGVNTTMVVTEGFQVSTN